MYPITGVPKLQIWNYRLGNVRLLGNWNGLFFKTKPKIVISIGFANLNHWPGDDVLSLNTLIAGSLDAWSRRFGGNGGIRWLGTWIADSGVKETPMSYRGFLKDAGWFSNLLLFLKTWYETIIDFNCTYRLISISQNPISPNNETRP